MSRSYRAWMENCAPSSTVRGVGEQAGLENQTRLEQKPLLGAVSSIKCLLQSLLVALLIAATALAGSASAQAKSQTTDTHQQTTHPHPAGSATLALGSGYFSRNAAARVRELQRRLAITGFSPGPIDGHYGPLTAQAVERFQASRGLQVDGVAGPLTLAAMHSSSNTLYPGAGYIGTGSGRVRAMQLRLAKAGFSPGPIDGRYGPLTKRAISRFQAAHGLQTNGIAGQPTLAKLALQQPTHHKTTRPTRPASSHQRANRPTPRAPQPQPTRAPTPKKALPATHSTGSPPLGLLVPLIALAVALTLAATWLVHRRRNKRYAAIDPTTNGTSRNGHPGVTAAEINHTTTPDPTSTPNPTTTPDPTSIPNPTTTPTPVPAEHTSGAGAFGYALLLEEQGDQQGAIAAYERADRLGHAAAAANLGVLLEQQGEQTAAEASYRRAERRGDANGAFNLAVLLEEKGDQQGAIAAYERADRLGHSAAAANLGVLLEQQGEQTAAEASYRRAERRGDANGAFNLAVLLEEKGDYVGALNAYQRAGRLGHPEIAEMARAAEVELSKHERPTRTGGGHDAS